jgi:N-acetylmuramoyl-L-alanine amidase
VVIVLDPGHGGANHGCRSADLEVREKDVTLDLAQALKEALAVRLPGGSVFLTRERDGTLPLAERVDMANRAAGDLFISIHANASPERNQEGFETYLPARDSTGAEAAWVPFAADPWDAPREAAVHVRELTASTHRRRAAFLARAMQEEQRTRFPGRLDRGVREARFDVLAGVRMPAVLTEVGFLDHAREGILLQHDGFRRLWAEAVAAAVDRYLREVASEKGG